MRVASFFPARNEEDVVGRTIKSLLNQTITIDPIVLIDDGSTDQTSKIGEELGCIVIKLPYHEENWVGTPNLAIPCNAGLSYIREKSDPDWILQMGADHYLPSDYAESIISRMEEDPLVKVASGRIGYQRIPYMPNGSGRIVNAAFWEEISGLKYPFIYGWESWLLYKTWSMGYKTRNYLDIVTEARPVRMYSEKAYRWGKSMWSLGSSPYYVVLRSGLFFLRSPKNGIAMFLGYLEGAFSDESRAEPEVRRFTGKIQYQNLLSKIGLAEKVNYL